MQELIALAQRAGRKPARNDRCRTHGHLIGVHGPDYTHDERMAVAGLSVSVPLPETWRTVLNNIHCGRYYSHEGAWRSIKVMGKTYPIIRRGTALEISLAELAGSNERGQVHLTRKGTYALRTGTVPNYGEFIAKWVSVQTS